MGKIKKLLKTVFKIVFSRMIIIFFLLAVQLVLVYAGFIYISSYYFAACSVLSAIVVIYIINKDDNPAYKLAWIVPVCAIPILGTLLYLFVELNMGSRGLKKKLDRRLAETGELLKTTEIVREHLRKENRELEMLSAYIESKGGYPSFENTEVQYFPSGEDKFRRLLADLEQAKQFIFLEYFIVEEGKMWDAILDILKRKAAEGVEIRVMYDGMCSILLLPYHYPQKLQKYGIQAKMFSPIKPLLSTHQNNRDHRKIFVIDGKVAYTGGVNLADEYINEKVVFGHWKDVAVRLEGDAAQGFTLMFLQMWNVSETGGEDYRKYLRSDKGTVCGSGYVIPYGDSPNDKENVGENVYLDILYTARKYVHIMTPYLIIDREMEQALVYAAKRGVDIRLLLPHIPDKKIPFYIAGTYYPSLLRAGVKIYEYTPGFVHGKCFVSDDEKAVVGSINLDYRSLYLHFECGVYLYKNDSIADIEADYIETLKNSQEVDLQYYEKTGLVKRLLGRVFRLFGPLM